MGLYSCLTFISRSTSRIFEFYCFMKELHGEIDCSTRIACRMLNFLLPIERASFDEKRNFEVEKFFISHCLNKNNQQTFFLMFQ